MARKKTKTSSGNLTLDMFMEQKPSGSSSNEAPSSTSNKPIQTAQTASKPQKRGEAGDISIDEFIEEMLSRLSKPSHARTPTPSRKERSKKEDTKQVAQQQLKPIEGEGTAEEGQPEVWASTKGEQEAGAAAKTIQQIIPGDILQELLRLPVGPERAVSCDNTGECSDGRRISEIFEDDYGIKRQRGFIRTSRIPIILDWVIEEATVEKVLPRAYSLTTSRGAIALIPEDFICELAQRYGVIIKNYDCKGYRVSLSGTSVRRKKS